MHTVRQIVTFSATHSLTHDTAPSPSPSQHPISPTPPNAPSPSTPNSRPLYAALFRSPRHPSPVTIPFCKSTTQPQRTACCASLSTGSSRVWALWWAS